MSTDTQEMPAHRDSRAQEARHDGDNGRAVVDAAVGRSHTGRVRPDNQDSMYVGEMLFAVADGMGGRRSGAVAAQTALDTVTGLDRRQRPLTTSRSCFATPSGRPTPGSGLAFRPTHATTAWVPR